eukprot:CAMPEP_0181109998 /NCGR_PEP_ID=MMETSP1071-20121207/18481_1 /TAXON_ID=35127 /ORGANISM="Thalassiosira sp., Strain NH16" /LENGTH=190 /DNA_ID=CAMNT_0023193743 /DNA_START=58 /DNA_END=630 /DNA_ORIENTATION=+
MTSVDEDLARFTSKSLSMGSSLIRHIDSSSCVLPRKLHPSLYNSSLKDVYMGSGQKCNNGNHGDGGAPNRTFTSGGGVPGFPDFPDCWQGGEISEGRRNDVQMGRADKKRMQKWRAKTNARLNRQHQQRLVRKAVNTSGINKRAVGNGKEIKKGLRDERRMRRIEKIVKLQERRRRKREMGDICRSLASI